MTGSLVRHAANTFRWSRKKWREVILNSAGGTASLSQQP